jgi:hypothetical protein
LEATPESFTTETASSGLSFAFGEFGTDPETGVTTPNGSSGKRDNDGTGDLRSSKRQKKPQTKAKEQEDDVAITWLYVARTTKPRLSAIYTVLKSICRSRHFAGFHYFLLKLW